MRPPRPSPTPLLILGFVIATTAVGQTGQRNWPQWRGPDGDGISKETGWEATGKEESLWKAKVGIGYSTVSIQDGRLFTQGHDKEKKEDTIWCLDAKSGEEIWKYSFPAKTWDRAHGGGTLSTPSVDGDRLFVLNREGNFFCLEAATGKVRWHKQLKDQYKLRYPKWAFSASPLVFDDMVVMNVGLVLAFEKKSGKVKWKSSRNYGDAYATPTAFEFKGRSCLAVFNGNGLVAMERKQGREIAFHEWKTKYDINAATPIALGNRIFISSGYNHGSALLELSGSKLKVIWENKVMRNKMSGCVLFENHLYGFDEKNLKCMDLQGQEKWAQRGLGNGALVIAGGRICALSSRGDLVIAEASAEGYRELSRAPVLSGGVYWTTPVLLNGLLYCRNSVGDLVCRDHRGRGN